MKVVHLYDGHEAVYNGQGSLPDVVWNLARYSASMDNDVTIIERQWSSLPPEEDHENVQFKRLSLGTGPEEPWSRIPYEMVNSPLGLARLIGDRINFALHALIELQNTSFDILHVHLPFAANVLVTIAPRIRNHMIYTAHLGETQQRVIDPILSPDVYLSKRVAQTVALNPQMKAAFEQKGVDSNKLTIIPNGVDLEPFQNINQCSISKVEEKYDLQNKKIILFVGTITPRKGVLELVKAANSIINDSEVRDIQFILVGKKHLDSDYVEKIQDEIGRFSIEDEVVLTGFIPRDDLLPLYACADLFVLPSFEEGSSIAISEAIASGTPVVASDIAGNAQQIDDGVHGYLVEAGNKQVLADRIEYSLTNPNVHMSMQQAVKDRAREISWQKISQQYINTYKKLTRE